jgi:hypothetical protein
VFAEESLTARGERAAAIYGLLGSATPWATCWNASPMHPISRIEELLPSARPGESASAGSSRSEYRSLLVVTDSWGSAMLFLLNEPVDVAL